MPGWIPFSPTPDQYLSDTLAPKGANLLGRCLLEIECVVITEFHWVSAASYMSFNFTSKKMDCFSLNMLPAFDLSSLSSVSFPKWLSAKLEWRVRILPLQCFQRIRHKVWEGGHFLHKSPWKNKGLDSNTLSSVFIVFIEQNCTGTWWSNSGT